MPALRNTKHEIFAQEVAKAAKTGKSVTQCYEASGYTTTGHASEAAASRLLSSVEVKGRIDEIMAPRLRKAGVTIESLLDELETTIRDARSDGQHNAVISALTLSAKLVGLLRDKIEIGGPGEFDHLQSVEDVGSAMLTQMSPALALETLDAIRSRVEALAASQAADVTPGYQRRDEVGPAMKALRHR